MKRKYVPVKWTDDGRLVHRDDNILVSNILYALAVHDTEDGFEEHKKMLEQRLGIVTFEEKVQV